MIYSDAYLFELATTRLESGETTIEAARHLVRTCRISEAHATRIVSIAFDPSNVR